MSFKSNFALNLPLGGKPAPCKPHRHYRAMLTAAARFLRMRNYQSKKTLHTARADTAAPVRNDKNPLTPSAQALCLKLFRFTEK